MDMENKILAVRSVRAGQMGYKRATKQFIEQKGTLERCVKDSTKSLEELVQVKLGRRPILPDHIEGELMRYCIEMDARHYGLRRNDVKRMAFQLAMRNGIQHPFSLQRQSAGKNCEKFMNKRQNTGVAARM
jgi:hypothetical protein